MQRRLSRFQLGVLAIVVASSALLAQTDDKSREKEMRTTPLWKKQPLDPKELDRCLLEIRTGNVDAVEESLFKLALAYPDPRRTRDVIAAAKSTKGRVSDSFYRLSYSAICTEWEGAEVAARTLTQAKRSGGIRFLEQQLQSENGLTRQGARAALRFSGDPQAGEVLVRNYDVDRLSIRVTLADIGPTAAPAVTELFKSSEWQVRNDALYLLKEIGTEKELDAVQMVASSDPNRLVKENAKRTVAAIKARSK